MLSLYILYAVLTLVGVLFAWKLKFAFDHFKIKEQPIENASLDDLPSVSVCVPARNEKNAMSQCLETIVASTYPKLEVIVFDDSSADNTSFLIKSFARAGVRFVEGTKLSEGWLGKNQALQTLLEESSGDYILYMDVDTHIQPHTITKLILYIKQQNVSMVSVLPRREDGIRPSVMLGTLRYFWTLILHSKSSPAVSSGAWMIDRNKLMNELGGITNYKSLVQPELAIASKLGQTNQYRFLMSDKSIGVTYEKKWSSQIDTSVRIMYPVLGKGWKLYLSIIGLLVLNTPTLAMIAGLIEGWSLVQVIALWQISIYVAIYALYLSKVWGKGWWFGALLWPYIIAQELVVVFMSIDQHLRKVVSWKGRPITATYRSPED
jgi:glycosyltransferase involved in cell wall biosynthesis